MPIFSLVFNRVAITLVLLACAVAFFCIKVLAPHFHISVWWPPIFFAHTFFLFAAIAIPIRRRLRDRTTPLQGVTKADLTTNLPGILIASFTMALGQFLAWSPQVGSYLTEAGIYEATMLILPWVIFFVLATIFFRLK